MRATLRDASGRMLRPAKILLVLMFLTLFSAMANGEDPPVNGASTASTQIGWSTALEGADKAKLAFGGDASWGSARASLQAAKTSLPDIQAIAASSSGSLSAMLGLTPEFQLGGIGGYFLNVIFGSDLLARVVGGDSQEGPSNHLMGAIIKFATYLGMAVAIAFGVVHAITMFFSYLEYGDILGEARERMIGAFRAVITLMLISPMTTDGLAPAQYAAMWAAAGSNGMGNKLAFVVAGKGFGDPQEGGSVFSLDSSASFDPRENASAFSEMVGAESCRRQMGAMGRSAASVRSVCGRITISSVDIENATTVDINIGELSDSQIEASCDDMDDTALKNTCISVRQQQRASQASISDLYETYGNDLSSDAARADMEALANVYVESIGTRVEDINASVCSETNACQNSAVDSLTERMHEAAVASGVDPADATFEIDNVVATTAIGQEFQGMIVQLGWPGLATIYSSLGDRVDAVGRIQSNGTDSSGWQVRDSIRQANSTLVRVNSQIQSDRVQALVAAEAAGDAYVRRGVGETLGDLIGYWFGEGAVVANEAAQTFFIWLLDPLFTQPGPAATYELGANVLGTLMAAAAIHDFLTLIPGGEVATSAVTTLVETVSSKLGSGTEGIPFGEGSLILYALMAGFGLLLIFVMMISLFLVMVLPKLPILIVAMLMAEWAIWSAIIVFGSTIWVAVNLSNLTNTPHLATMAFLRGIGVLMYLFLYPMLVVVAIVISVIIYNLLVPTLAMMLMGSFNAGFVDSILGIFALPFVILFAVALAAFLSITAIARIPDMINGMLGIQSPGQSISGSMMSYMGGPQNYNNAADPRSAFTNAMAAGGK